MSIALIIRRNTKRPVYLSASGTPSGECGVNMSTPVHTVDNATGYVHCLTSSQQAACFWQEAIERIRDVVDLDHVYSRTAVHSTDR